MELEIFWIWIIIGLVATILEAVTLQLVSIWFVIGAFCSLIAYLFGGSIVCQVVVFFVVSFICLITLLPFFKRRLKKKYVPTNADTIIGKTATVLETIDNQGNGLINIDGKSWSAKSASETIISKDSKVRVIEIKGVKAVVEKLEENPRENKEVN